MFYDHSLKIVNFLFQNIHTYAQSLHWGRNKEIKLLEGNIWLSRSRPSLYICRLSYHFDVFGKIHTYTWKVLAYDSHQVPDKWVVMCVLELKGIVKFLDVKTCKLLCRISIYLEISFTQVMTKVCFIMSTQ